MAETAGAVIALELSDDLASTIVCLAEICVNYERNCTGMSACREADCVPRFKTHIAPMESL